MHQNDASNMLLFAFLEFCLISTPIHVLWSMAMNFLDSQNDFQSPWDFSALLGPINIILWILFYHQISKYWISSTLLSPPKSLLIGIFYSYQSWQEAWSLFFCSSVLPQYLLNSVARTLNISLCVMLTFFYQKKKKLTFAVWYSNLYFKQGIKM